MQIQKNMTFREWQQMAQRVNALVGRIDALYYRRANACAQTAGVGPARNVWHNALLARADGRPWPEVDYDALRAARYWDRRRDDARAIGERVVNRAWHRVTF